jgi:hypothetical protein
MTITAIPRITTAQPSENVTVEDVAAMFAADGVTIAKYQTHSSGGARCC